MSRTAAARHVYAVLDDPEDKNSKLFVKAKNNLARDTKALRYGMDAIRRLHISSPSAPISGTDCHDMNRIAPLADKVLLLTLLPP